MKNNSEISHSTSFGKALAEVRRLQSGILKKESPEETYRNAFKEEAMPIL